jgi:hypothetical protein
LVVITIIGIILSFVLVTGMEAANRANERATQTLITKLEGGMADRLEALLETRPDYNAAHLFLANVYYNATTTNSFQLSLTRAQVIAWYDYIKAEMPDVFVYSAFDTNYPLNFAGVPYPTASALQTCSNYILPLGQADNLNPQLSVLGTGVYGASYTAAAGIYKNLSVGGIKYVPAGYDGIDNDGNGMVDDIAEGIPVASNQTTFINAIATTHKHTTARSEMLYALLVEGRGPLGSVFTRDDFTDKEVQDTDNDGLPEFVDAWGQPLQFYRWPVLYHSDIQLGQVVVNNTTLGGTGWTLTAPYQSVFQNREQDTLDPNQQLMAPAWWSANSNVNFPLTLTSTVPKISAASSSVQAFQSFFHTLTEPMTFVSGSVGNYWDRSTNTGFGSRRAFYSKFLIVSGGPDQTVGIFRYPDASPPTAIQLIANENSALPFGLDVIDFTGTTLQITSPTTISGPSSNNPVAPNSFDIQQAAQDDISNQNLMATGGIGGSG